MATEVAVLVARLEADVRDFDRDLKKASKRLGKLESATKGAGRATDKTKGSMKGLGGTMKAVFAGAAAFAVLKFTKDTISASSDLNESINAVNVVFGESAEGVKLLGESADDSLGLAESSFNDLAVGFSTFVEKVAEEKGGTVVQVLDDLTQRTADFASVMNLDVAEAGAIFRSTLAGETEPIKKFGLDISAAAVNLKAMELGLKDSTAELTEQDKVLARYELLMEQTQKTQGDFANTSDDFANAMRRLGAKIENVKAKLGDALIPVLEDLIPLGEDVVDWVAKAAVEFGDLTGSLSPAEASLQRLRIETAGLSGVDGLPALGAVLKDAKDRIDPFFDGVTTTSGGMEKAKKRTDEWDEAMKFLVEEINLTEEDLDTLNEKGFGVTLESLGLMQEDVDKLAKLLRFKLDAAVNVTAGRLKDKLEVALADNEQAVRDATDAVRLYGDELLALTDPYVNAIKRTQDLEDATKDYTSAVIEFGPDSQEAITAGLDLALSQAAVDAAMKKVAEEGGPAALQAFQDLLRDAGLLDETLIGINDTIGPGLPPLWTPAALQDMKDAKENLEDILNATESIVTTSGFPSVPIQGGIDPISAGPNILRQHGGPFTAHQPFIAGEHGPELISPMTSGQVLTSVPTGGTSTVINNVRFGTTIGSDRKLKELAERARRQ